MGFWKNFIDTFAMQGYKLYTAAESYGGLYGPYISYHMLQANNTNYYDPSGLLVYDGVSFDPLNQLDAVKPGFAAEHADLFQLSDPERKRISDLAQSCCGSTDYMKKYLAFPPPENVPSQFPDTKPSNRLEYYRFEPYREVQISNHCFNP